MWYRIETRRPDGTWQNFSDDMERPAAEAQDHLGRVRAFAKERGVPPDDARLHELTDEERKNYLLANHPEAFDAYVKALSVDALEAIVRAHERGLGRNVVEPGCTECEEIARFPGFSHACETHGFRGDAPAETVIEKETA